MLPKKLTLKGVYSYQEQQTIDFEYLTQAQLFGVFGSVGSGKSTLLEAISFALYGQTERLGGHDDLKYNMMNLKSSELYIEFEFENHDGKNYRFTVSGKRNSKKFEEVRTFVRGAYVFENKEWIPLPSSSAKDIIGLSYDNFRRTIIIPQGKFQEFLQLGITERTRMLKDIFNLSKYEYEDKIKVLRTKNNQEREHLLGRLTNYENVSKEILKTKEEELKKIEKLVAVSNNELEKLKKLEKQQSIIKEHFTVLKTKKEALIEHEKQKKRVLNQEKELIEYEDIILKFKDKLIRNKEIQADKLALEKEKTGSENKIKELEDKKVVLDKKIKEIEVNQALVPKVEQELNDLELLLKITTKKLENEDKGVRIKNGRAKVEETERKLKELQSILNELKESQKKVQTTQENKSIETFSEMKNWFTKYALLKKEKEKIQKELAELINLNSNKKTTFLAQLTNVKITEELNALIIKELLESKTIEKVKLEKDLKTQLEKINSYKVKKELEKLANSVEEGKPCPLCGALDHPEILNIESIDKHLDIEEKKFLELEKNIKIYNNELENTRFFENDLKTSLEQISKVKENLKTLENTLKIEKENFKWTPYTIDDEVKVKNDFDVFIKQEKRLKELALKQEKINEKISVETSNKDKFSKAIVAIELAFNAIKTEIETYKNN